MREFDGDINAPDFEMNQDEAWLRHITKLDDGGFVSVGGWITELEQQLEAIEDEQNGMMVEVRDRHNRLRFVIPVRAPTPV